MSARIPKKSTVDFILKLAKQSRKCWLPVYLNNYYKECTINSPKIQSINDMFWILYNKQNYN